MINILVLDVRKKKASVENNRNGRICELATLPLVFERRFGAESETSWDPPSRFVIRFATLIVKVISGRFLFDSKEATTGER